MDFNSVLEQERRKAQQLAAAQQQQAALDAYNYNKAVLDNKYNNNQGGLGGFLGNLAGNVIKGFGDIGNGLIDMFGSGIASARDLGSIITTGKSAGENEKWLMSRRGTDNAKDAYLKTSGTALNAATNLASTAIPGLSGTVPGLGRAVVTGGLSGIADELQTQGKDATAENALKRAATGAAAGVAAGAVGRKIGNAKSGFGKAVLNNGLAQSAVGRGAIAGAVGGAVGGGLGAGLEGQNILSGAAQGATQGAISGGVTGGITDLARRAVGKGFSTVRDSIWDAQKAKQAQAQAQAQSETSGGALTAKDKEVLNNLIKTEGDKDFAEAYKAATGKEPDYEEFKAKLAEAETPEIKAPVESGEAQRFENAQAEFNKAKAKYDKLTSQADKLEAQLEELKASPALRENSFIKRSAAQEKVLDEADYKLQLAEEAYDKNPNAKNEAAYNKALKTYEREEATMAKIYRDFEGNTPEKVLRNIKKATSDAEITAGLQTLNDYVEAKRLDNNDVKKLLGDTSVKGRLNGQTLWEAYNELPTNGILSASAREYYGLSNKGIQTPAALEARLDAARERQQSALDELNSYRKTLEAIDPYGRNYKYTDKDLPLDFPEIESLQERYNTAQRDRQFIEHKRNFYENGQEKNLNYNTAHYMRDRLIQDAPAKGGEDMMNLANKLDAYMNGEGTLDLKTIKEAYNLTGGEPYKGAFQDFINGQDNLINEDMASVQNLYNSSLKNEQNLLNQLNDLNNQAQTQPINKPNVLSVSGKDEQYTFASTDKAPRDVKQAALDYSYETDGRIDPSELTDFYDLANRANRAGGDIHALAEQYAYETDGRVDPNELVDFVTNYSGIQTTPTATAKTKTGPVVTINDNPEQEIQNRNWLQGLGDELRKNARETKWMGLYESLDQGTARRALATDAPGQLAKLGVMPENYNEYAKTSNYVNNQLTKIARESDVRVQDPELVSKLSLENSDAILSDNAAKKYNTYVKQIVADGNNPTEYTAAYLLEKSRDFGNKAAKLSGNADDVKALRTALYDAKWTLRNEATQALEQAGATGDLTTDLLAKGLNRLGANQKVVDYYSAPNEEGNAPNVSDYIKRSSLFEQARDMGNQMSAEQYTRNASKGKASITNQLMQWTGIDKPLKTVGKNLVAPISSGLQSVAGTGLTKLGNFVASTPSATPLQQTIINDYIGRTIGNAAGGDIITAAERERDYNNINNLSRMLGQAAYSAPAEIIGLESANIAPIASVGSTTPTTTGTTSVMSTDPTAQLQRIANGMNAALAAGDISAYNQLANLYTTAAKMYQLQYPTEASTASDLSTSEKNQLAKLQSAETALDRLEELYDRAGGGQGFIGGNLSNFLGGIGLNSNVSTYNQLAQGLVNQIGAAIGKTDSLNTEGEVQRALSLVPQITDDAQTARNKLAELRRMLQENQNIYSNLYY